MKTNSLILAAGILLLLMSKASSQSLSTVQFSSANYTANENGGTVTLVVERFGDPGAMAFVEYATRDGTAIHGEDYVEQTGFLQFIGETNLTILIPILNDAVEERDEIFFVSLLNPDPFITELGTIAEAVVTIRRNDHGVEFSPSTYIVSEATGVVLVTVRGEADGTNAFSVDYFTHACSASAGLDFIGQSGTLHFEPGETEKSIAVAILDDSLGEAVETLTLSLGNAVGIHLGLQKTAVLMIQDNDPEGPDTLELNFAPRLEGRWSNPAGIPPGFPNDVAVAGHFAYVRMARGDLQVFDISNPAGPQRVGGLALDSGGYFRLAVSGNFVFMGGGGLPVIDVSDPINPRRVGGYDVYALDMAISEDVAYVAGSSDGLHVLNIRDPANPEPLAVFRGNQYTECVAVAGNYAYVGDGTWDGQSWQATLRIIDISDPSTPQEMSHITTRGVPKAVGIFGHHAFVLSNLDDIEIIDISDPVHPERVGSYADESYIERIVFFGNYAFLVEWTGLQVLDLSNPANPQRVASYDLDGATAVAIAGHYAFVTGVRGLEVLDIADPGKPLRAGDYETLNGPQDVAVLGHHAFVADGVAGLRIFDFNDRANPQLVGHAATSNGAYRVVITCDQAIVTEGSGFAVFDISQPSNPRRVGSYQGDRGVSTLAAEGSRAYLFSRAFCPFGCVDATVEIVDFSDAAESRRLGIISLVRGDAMAVSGGYVYVVNGFPGVTVIDARDPSSPQEISTVNPLPGRVYQVAISGHHGYLIKDDFNSPGGLILQVTALVTPSELQPIGYCILRNPSSYLLELKVVKGYAYVRGSGGLEIIDVRDPVRPRWVASYAATAGSFTVSGDEAILLTATGLEIVDLNPPGFRPGSITRLANGQIQFTLSTRRAQSYTVQTSTNLVNWEFLETRRATDTQTTFIDTNATDVSRRFYRAVSQ